MWLNGYFTLSAVVPLSSSSASVSMSKIRTSAFYLLHPQISSTKFIRNLPIATYAFTTALYSITVAYAIHLEVWISH